MFQVPARFAFNSEARHVNLVLTGDILHYYRWLIVRRYGWIEEGRWTLGERHNDDPVPPNNMKRSERPRSLLMRPLYGAHITVIHHRKHEVTRDDWERLRFKYDEQETTVTLNPWMSANNAKKRFWTFALQAECEDATKLQDAFNIPNNKRGRLHLTVGNTKDSI